jgi:hypothetical protein
MLHHRSSPHAVVVVVVYDVRITHHGRVYVYLILTNPVPPGMEYPAGARTGTIVVFRLAGLPYVPPLI